MRALAHLLPSLGVRFSCLCHFFGLDDALIHPCLLRCTVVHFLCVVFVSLMFPQGKFLESVHCLSVLCV